MAIGAIYELTHTSLLFNKPVVNVYHYRAESADTSAQDLASAFQQDVLSKIGGIQTDEVQTDRVRVITLFDFTDFFDGTVASPIRNPADDTLPRSVAINFTLRTARRDVGPGAKRYAGQAAAWQDDNTWLDVGFLAGVEILRLQLPAAIGISDPIAYKPVIVKRIFYEATETAKEGWYMPREEADLVYAYVTSAALSVDVSHQVSRD